MDGPGTDVPGSDDANPPALGRSTDCRSRSTPVAGRPGVLRILLSGRREGSASAFRTSRLRQRTEDVMHVAEDVRVDVLLGECKGLERGVGVTEDFKAVSYGENGIGFIVMLKYFSCICAYHCALCLELP